jgi:hypothetical protein
MSTAFRRRSTRNPVEIYSVMSRSPGFVACRSTLIAAGAVCVVLAAAPARAQLTFFTDRAAFNASAVGLVTEDFEEAVLGSGNAAAMGNPLDAATNNGIFSTGQIEAGLRISVPESSSVTAIAVFGPGFAPFISSKAVYGNSSFTSVNLSFLNGTTSAVGFDLLTYAVNGPRTVSFYDASDALLGTVNVSGLTSGTFVGVTSTVPIARVNTGRETGRNTGVDNVSFGIRSNPDDIPEPATLALLLPAALAFRRRR